MEPIERVVRRARLQYGLISHAQCLALGMAASTINRRLSTGSWTQIRRGVYVVGGVPPSWEQSLMAVSLSFDDCWLSHGTGARLLGLTHAPEIGGIEALRPYGRYRRLDGVIAHRSRIITPADVTRHKRIAVTSVGRTIVDCSGRLTVATTAKMLDDAMRHNKRVLEETRAAFARLAGGGRRRFGNIREVLGKRIPGYDPGESDLELRAINVLTSAGLPMPVQQLRIVLNRQRRRIDLAYPELRIAIELLGWAYHGLRGRWDDDHARANELVAIDWRLLQFTSETTDADMVRLVTAVRGLAA
jgi:predicted transcriptional regulator of viral defense system